MKEILAEWQLSPGEIPHETEEKPQRPSVRIISFQWRFQMEILPNC